MVLIEFSSLLIHSLILLLTFYLLAQVCDNHFVPALEKIGKKFNMSTDVTGATLMAVGSSAPELFIAIIAIIKPGDAEGGHIDIGIGTIVGSALFNILVIIGAVAVVKKTVLSWQPIIRDMIFYSLSIIVLVVSITNGFVNFWEALVCVLLYAVYIYAVFKWKIWFPYKDRGVYSDEEKVHEKKIHYKRVGYIIKPIDFLLDMLFPKKANQNTIFLISILIIAGLCWLMVDSAIMVSEILHIPEFIIAITVLAVGTSVPDLVSSVIVAKQGKGGMAISNAFGSNIFDILIGLGFPWLLLQIFSNREIEILNDNMIISVILLFATVLIVFFVLYFRKWKIRPRTGYILLSIYLLYIIWQIVNHYVWHF